MDKNSTLKICFFYPIKFSFKVRGNRHICRIKKYIYIRINAKVTSSGEKELTVDGSSRPKKK